jgi:hypothetical protein
VLLKTHVGESEPLVSVFTFEGRRIVRVRDYDTMEAAEAVVET